MYLYTIPMPESTLNDPPVTARVLQVKWVGLLLQGHCGFRSAITRRRAFWIGCGGGSDRGGMILPNLVRKRALWGIEKYRFESDFP